MSHISTIKTQVNDLDALDEACRSLGLELRREQRTHRTFGGRQSECEAAIVLPGNADAYEVGVLRGDKPGTYQLAFDDWGGGHGMVAKTGEGCRTLLVEYARAKTKRLARAKGWSYREERLPDGRYRIHCQPKAKQAWAGASRRSW